MPTRIAKYSSLANSLDHCHSNFQLQPVVFHAPLNTGAGYAGVRVGGIGVFVGVGDCDGVGEGGTGVNVGVQVEVGVLVGIRVNVGLGTRV
jgi:hypothetical protein